MQWRLTDEIKKTDIQAHINTTLNSNYNNLEDLYSRGQKNEIKLKENMEKIENRLGELRAIENIHKESELVSGHEQPKIPRRSQQMNSRRFSARMSLKFGGMLGMGRKSLIAGDFQGRRMSRIPTTKRSWSRLPCQNKPSSTKLDVKLATITENEGAEINMNERDKIINPREPKCGEIAEIDMQNLDNINKLREDIGNIHEKLVDLREEVSLQRERAEQMKNAYLDAKQQIVILTHTMQDNQKVANSMLMKEVQVWQLKLTEIKVHIYIYI